MDGTDRAGNVYSFDNFVVDAVRRTMTQGSQPIAITSKALDTLLFLLQHSGTTVTKRQIMEAVWPDTAVEENNLTQQISALRKALGEQPNAHRFIVTVPGTGYAFVAPLAAKRENTTDKSLRQRFFAEQGGLGYVLAMLMVIVGAFSLAAGIHRQASHGGPATIAVLSFHSLDVRDDPVAAGMPYTLTAKLGDLREVMSVRPAAGLVDSNDVLAAGRELQVDAVLNGTVQHSGDKVRVSVQMVDVSGGRVIWGRNIDANDDSGFSVQDAVATDVVAGLKELYARD